MLALLAATTQVTTLIISMTARLWEGADAWACKCMASYLSDLLLLQPGIDGGAGLPHVMLYGRCYLKKALTCSMEDFHAHNNACFACSHHTGHHTHHLN
jgi:hypothetical protein